MGARTHILLTVIGVVVVGFGLVFLVVEPLIEGALRSDHEERARWLAQVLARDLAQSTRNEDDLTERLAELSSAANDVCLGIVDSARQVSLQTRDDLRHCLSEDELSQLLKKPDESRWFETKLHGQRLGLTTVLHVQSMAAPGRLVMVTQVHGVAGRLSAARTTLLLFMGLALLLACVIGYTALTQLIIRPLDRTAKAIDRVHAGDMDARAVPSGGVELRQLAQSFNRLTRKLKEDEQRIAHQISELKLINEKLERARDSLVRSEKLATVGQLAAGVAHEIGNPIGIVLGYMEMLGSDDVTDEERREYVARCAVATERISGIIKDLLDFARAEPDASLVEADAAYTINATLQLLEPQKPFRHVTVEFEPPLQPILVGLEERRLQQVLLNLLMNAADATRDQAEPAVIGIRVEEKRDRILIHVTDNGPGMSRSVRSKVFDPFFTTKEPGSGTGLGLSICYNIITTCGGDIRVESGARKGTTFTLDLPPTARAGASDAELSAGLLERADRRSEPLA